MSDTPFIKFYPSDFLAGTSGLSPAERGVYITMLCLIYEMDGPISRDDARLARRCGAPKAAFKRILESLIEQGKITQTDGVLSNRRAEKALMDRANRTQNATHAANSRWGAHEYKTQQNQEPSYSDAMPQQCVADASQKPEPEPDKGGGGSARARESDQGKDDLTFREQLLAACGADPVSGMTGPTGRRLGDGGQMATLFAVMAANAVTEAEVLTVAAEAMLHKRDGPPSTLGYLVKPIERYANERDQAAAYQRPAATHGAPASAQVTKLRPRPPKGYQE